jgi:hypothetical protein
MSDSTYEEAVRCPKCRQPGDVQVKRGAPKEARLPVGTMLHTVYCMNQVCPWFETCWMIQVNRDGTVPPPKDHRGGKKVYQGFEGHDDLAKQIVAGLEAQQRAETDPDVGKHEIRGPR